MKNKIMKVNVFMIHSYKILIASSEIYVLKNCKMLKVSASLYV